MKILLTLILLLLLVAGGAAAFFWYSLTQPYQAFSADGVFVDVPRGASSRSVARLLEVNGVIRSSMAFEVYARRHPKRTLQAGEYFFTQPATGRDIFWKVAKGQVYEQPFTVREGETMFDIARNLEAGKFMLADDFLKAASDGTMVHDVAPHATSLEGFLFPATYDFLRKTTSKQLVQQQVIAFCRNWKQVNLAYARSKNLTPYDVLTIASLIQGEAVVESERPLIAAVIYNRLHLRMSLGIDAALRYALDIPGTESIRESQLQNPTPYNLRLHAGLPPTPIDNPGLASIQAAAHPAKVDYLYFVAKPDKRHHFFTASASAFQQYECAHGYGC